MLFARLHTTPRLLQMRIAAGMNRYPIEDVPNVYSWQLALGLTTHSPPHANVSQPSRFVFFRAPLLTWAWAQARCSGSRQAPTLGLMSKSRYIERTTST